MGNRASLPHLKGAPAVLGKENRKFCIFFPCLPTIYGGMNSEGILVGILLMF